MMKNHTPKPVDAVPDFPLLEKNLLDYWRKSGIVDKYLQRNDKSKKYFSFIDGPITANNPMGVHHGWGRTYKDVWQRFYNMMGFKQRFQNGFDAQGLWVEVEVEKQLGFKTKKDIEKYGIAKFVQKCKDHVMKYSRIQTEQSKRLGYFMDWDNSYYTHSDENNYMIWHFLKECHKNGWLYKGKDSVPWCPRCETAISQHEMLTEDYKEVVHESIYLALPIEGRRNEYLLVWTTTPWTIPANIAVAVDKKLDYALVKSEGGKTYWVAHETVKRVFLNVKHRMVRTAKGSQLVGLKYRAPFDDLPAVQKVARENPKTFHTVIPTDTRILQILTTEGTGLVHTAVSAGSEDFKLGKKLGLPMIPVIQDNAEYFPEFGVLSGKNAKKHPEVVLDEIRALDEKPGQHWAFKIENYLHRYPTCWRCKTELVWKVTDEWYIAMDKPSKSKAKTQNSKVKTLRERMMEVTKKIRWIPTFGLDRELDWLENMQDWLISKKNRYWGLCLPIWECEECGGFEVIGSKVELKKRAVDGWDQFQGKSPHKPQIDKVKVKCKKCGETISRIEPVGSPWLDAGIVPFSTISKDNKSAPLYRAHRSQWEKWFPADFITESFPGQFKNWFYSLIAMATVLENKEPFKTVLGFATLLGEDGRPMHKSWGNAVEFNEGADRIGVDVMRWMYVTQNPTQNLLFGYQTASMVRRQFHLILWNSYRFVANNMAVEKPDLKKNPRKLDVLDRWILSRLNNTTDKVTKALLDYNANDAAKHLDEFVQDFSTWYIRRSREKVGPTANNQTSKFAFYHTSIEVLTTLSKLLAPFTPFIADVIFRNLTGETSVHLADWPRADKKMIDRNLEEKMEIAREIVEGLHALRKKHSRKVRQPLRAWSFDAKEKNVFRNYPGILELIEHETNVKVFIPADERLLNLEERKDARVEWTKVSSKYLGEITIYLDLNLTKELEREGNARELIRRIQKQRKKLGTKLNEKVVVTVPTIPKGFEEEIKRRTLTGELTEGKPFKVVKAN
ncbi:isoleucine--tRNA ligase [Patescibacteria group bacterium]|nr:isoleucine--tRNA ligase [Patescibacteria group bacterium]